MKKKILFVQGLGMTKHEWNNSFDEIAERLRSAGFETVQFDFPIFHDGKVIELPVYTRAKYLRQMVETYKPDGILAQSYGVCTFLASHVSGYKSVVFVSGAYKPNACLRKVYTEKGVHIDEQGDTSLPRSSGEITTVTKEFWTDLIAFDDLKEAQTITSPLLMLHGSNDSKIPVADAHQLFERLGSTKKQIKIFEGGDHGIKDVPSSMREEFLGDIVSWFSSTL